MQEITLAELAKKMNQSEIAKALGCRQSAISHAICDRRNIRVMLADGNISGAYELKPFPSR